MTDERTLDPENWDEARRTFHDAVDCCFDWLKSIRDEPVWRETPPAVKEALAAPAPSSGTALPALFDQFRRDILPYGNGNTHPRFFGWVHGGGSVAGALGELLAGFLNANVAGRDHVAVYVERQVVDWCKDIFGFPASASGLLTTGTSMGTVIALAVARNARGEADIRGKGVAAAPRRLVGYASREVHSAIVKAFELLGLGHDALRLVPVDDKLQLSLPDLARMIAEDRAAGFNPAIVVASAGTVNSGAIDDIDAIAALCRAQNLWLHIDGAFGALAILAPEHRAALAPIRHADSIAFDFHKWLQVPYDSGCVLVKDEAAHRAAFSTRHDYLAPHGRALGGGDPWFCEYGPEMSRGFRALKVWLTINAYGTSRLGETIARNCAAARHLAALVEAAPELELVAPVRLNVVCFRFVARGMDEPALDRLNEDIVAALQSEGLAAPSTTRIGGKLAVRACITNHRTQLADVEFLARDVVRRGRARATR